PLLTAISGARLTPMAGFRGKWLILSRRCAARSEDFGRAMADDDGRVAQWRKLFGRRRGKALRPRQKQLLAELLPRLSVPGVAREGDPSRAPVDVAAIFPDRLLWVEIGFGGGEHLVHQAQTNPQVGLIGCEPFINGVAMALGRIEEAGAENLRLHPGDARDLIELL